MKILIAEDQAQQARLLGNLVAPWGYEPQIVYDGETALNALLSPDAPRLALLDWGLPGMDGVDVCRAMRKEAGGPYTYIVLITGRGGREDVVAGLEAGADDFLPKPVEGSELRARLNAGRRILDLQEDLLAAQRDLRVQATRDALTKLWNRAAILEMLQREMERAVREGRPLGVILADLDHFKEVNDTHGHLTGDQVLAESAQRMLGCLRQYDAVGRYGGEEFLVVLPGCDGRATLALAERLRECLAAAPIDLGGGWLNVTASLGAVTWDGEERMDLVGLLRAADQALYRAKREGRNRALLADGPAVGEPSPYFSGATTNP